MRTKRKFLVLFLVVMSVINTVGCPTESCGKVRLDQMGHIVLDLADEPSGTPLFEQNYVGIIPEGTEVAESGALVPEKGFVEGEYFSRAFTKIVLPESVREIPEKAFYGMRELQEITIPAGVEKIAKNAFQRCSNLRIVENLSSQTVVLPTIGARINSCSKMGLDWYIDGKKVKEVPPGTTAYGKPKKFSLKYKLNGGKFVGKKVKKYTYSKITKLPKAKKKGYTFLGWSLGNIPGKTMMEMDDSFCGYAGTKTLVARWKKIQVKKEGKKIKIQVGQAPRARWDVACLYSTKKNMKDAKLIDLSGEHLTYNGKTGKFKGKDCTIRYNQKTKQLVCHIKNCKKGKTYYLQFRRIMDNLDTEDNDEAYGVLLDTFTIKKVKVKM